LPAAIKKQEEEEEEEVSQSESESNHIGDWTPSRRIQNQKSK